MRKFDVTVPRKFNSQRFKMESDIRNLDCHPLVFALRRKAVARQPKLFYLVEEFLLAWKW